MSVPAIVRDHLDGEDVVERVSLGGEDELFVTPTRTLVYGAEGILSNESVTEYHLDAERIVIEEGRRKDTIRLDHGIDGSDAFSVPSNELEAVLKPVLEGVLAAAGAIEPNESITRLYRLGELSLAITDAGVIKHVGRSLWDEDYERFDFDDVTDLDIEEGEVSSQIIIEIDHRPERIKTPSGDSREISQRIREALLEYHGIETFEEFRKQVSPPDDTDARSGTEEEPTTADSPTTEPEPTPDPEPGSTQSTGSTTSDLDIDLGELDASSLRGIGEAPDQSTDPDPTGGSAEGGREAQSTESLEAAGFQSADAVDRESHTEEILDELTELRTAVERQNKILEDQQRTIERLIEELKRGRGR
ncbi:MAG: hypothetical protein ABEH65_08690 [Halobacteriales archaeon]